MNSLTPEKQPSSLKLALEQRYTKILTCLTADFLGTLNIAQKSELMEFKLVSSEEVNSILNFYQRAFSDLSRETVNKLVKLAMGTTEINPLLHEQSR